MNSYLRRDTIVANGANRQCKIRDLGPRLAMENKRTANHGSLVKGALIFAKQSTRWRALLTTSNPWLRSLFRALSPLQSNYDLSTYHARTARVSGWPPTWSSGRRRYDERRPVRRDTACVFFLRRPSRCCLPTGTFGLELHLCQVRLRKRDVLWLRPTGCVAVILCRDVSKELLGFGFGTR